MSRRAAPKANSTAARSAEVYRILRRAALLLAAWALCGTAAACPKAAEVTQQHLLGLWRAEFEGQAQGATLLLEKHPEFAESLRGEINRNGERAHLAGDVEDGDLTLEESVNGVNISATWIGTMEDGSCGKEIRGTWQGARDPRPRAFILRKQPAWR